MAYRIPITSTALLAALLAAAPCARAGGADYRLDTVHTQVFFCVDHLGYSHSCGRLKVSAGTFHFDADDWSSARVEASIDTASLDLGDGAWSDKVRSAYLDAGTYPRARFVSKTVQKTGAREGIVHGLLTLHGRTQPVDLKLTFNRAGADGYTLHYVAGFSASATFRRSAFGIDRSPRDIGDEIELRIEAEGLRDKDAQVQASGDSASGVGEEH